MSLSSRKQRRRRRYEDRARQRAARAYQDGRVAMRDEMTRQFQLEPAQRGHDADGNLVLDFMLQEPPEHPEWLAMLPPEGERCLLAKQSLLFGPRPPIVRVRAVPVAQELRALGTRWRLRWWNLEVLGFA